MFAIIALIVAAPAIVTADHLLFACQNATNSICPYSLGGFFVGCLTVPQVKAADFCQRNGWQLANVNDYNQAAALQTQQWCAGANSTAFINSFNGLGGDPCMVQTREGEAVAGEDEACWMGQHYVLCQAANQITTQTTITSTRTIVTGPVRVTVTVTPCANSWSSHHKNLGSEQQLKNALERPCSNACSDNAISKSLKIVQQAVPFEKADAVCKRHGWRLADYTAGMTDAVGALSNLCNNNPQLFNETDTSQLWVRSYNGVDGAMCIFTHRQHAPSFLQNQPLAVSFGYNNAVCSSRLLFPLCDASCDPAPTAHGPVTGTFTTFTSATRTTETVRTAVNTITEYVTAWPKHNPRDRHCCCSDCYKRVF